MSTNTERQVDDEPPTRRVERVVNREIQEHNRRQQDKFFNDFIKPLIAPTIIGITGTIIVIIAGAIAMWLDVGTLKIQVAQLQVQVSENREARRNTTESKDDGMNRIETSINRLIDELGKTHQIKPTQR